MSPVPDPTPPTPNPPTPPAANPLDSPLHSPAIQAPWRMQYLESMGSDPAPAKPAPTGNASPVSDPGAASFLRDYWLAPHLDAANHVIVRMGVGMILLNAYPYSNGHLLVALGEGRARLVDYDPTQRAALWRLTDAAADLLDAALQPQGINIGVNQGRAAGAGVPGHLHVHLVPRWAGDVNFMTVVPRTRVIPASLEVMAERFRRAWGVIGSRWATL